MSNSYTSPPVLTDSSRVTAGQTIRTTEIARLADLQNYCFAVGGTHNVISQTFDDACFVQNATSFTTMIEYYIPILSRSHNDLNIRVSGFCATAGSQIKATLTFPTSTNTYSTTITITDSSRYGSVFNSGTITKASTETEEFAILSFDVKAPTGDEVEILGIQANWSLLSSPLPSGVQAVGSSRYIPQGATRQSADKPLTARFGVETLENITTLRRRGRSLVSWSGVANASSSSGLSIAANPPVGLGIGDQYLTFSEVALFSGMNEIDGLQVQIFLKAENITAPATISVEIFSYRFTLTANGWSSFNAILIRSEIERSNEFGLSMYRVGVMESETNRTNLLSGLNPIASTPYISALSIIGV